MKAWRRAGERGDLQLHHLQNYIRNLPLGPAVSTKTKPVQRWRSAGILKVAALIKEHGPELRKLLRLDVPAEEVLSAVEELASCARRSAPSLASSWRREMPNLSGRRPGGGWQPPGCRSTCA